MLDRLGKVRVVTGPASPSEARLRRAQALALGNGTAVKIARELISAKLTGQEVLVREKLKDIRAADLIAALGARLADATDLDAIRGIESRAAAEYWMPGEIFRSSSRERTQIGFHHIGSLSDQGILPSPAVLDFQSTQLTA